MAMHALAGSVCEAMSHGWLGQPVNTLSSLAYVLAGAYVLRTGGPRPSALALVAVGTGSLLYHGSTHPAAGVIHNGSLVVLAAALLLAWWRGSLTRPSVAAVVVLGVAVGVYFLTRTGGPLCRPDSVLQGHALWHVLTAIAAAVWLTRKPIDAGTVVPNHHLSH